MAEDSVCYCARSGPHVQSRKRSCIFTICQYESLQNDKSSHLLRILQLLHEAGVFLYSRNAEGLGLSANGVDKIVIRYGGCADGTLNFRGIAERDSFVGGLQRN